MPLPDEDAPLLACPEVPLIRLLGVRLPLARRMRTDELSRLQWRDFDLERGEVYLDETETDEPRDRDLDVSVLAALTTWRTTFCEFAGP